MSDFVQKRKAFMDVLRGVNARVAAKALNSLTPGVEWKNSSKGSMADTWAKAQTQPHHSGLGLVRHVTIESFREAVQKIQNEEKPNVDGR